MYASDCTNFFIFHFILNNPVRQELLIFSLWKQRRGGVRTLAQGHLATERQSGTGMLLFPSPMVSVTVLGKSGQSAGDEHF